MRRTESFCRRASLVLRIFLAVVALTARALVAPEEWRRHFTQPRLRGRVNR